MFAGIHGRIRTDTCTVFETVAYYQLGYMDIKFFLVPKRRFELLTNYVLSVTRLPTLRHFGILHCLAYREGFEPSLRRLERPVLPLTLAIYYWSRWPESNGCLSCFADKRMNHSPTPT